jgi:hypothetical protein
MNTDEHRFYRSKPREQSRRGEKISRKLIKR